MSARIVLACALLGALLGCGFALARGSDYRARSFVIRVPPDFSGAQGLSRARSDRVLGRALVLAGDREHDAAWLRERSTAELTSRLDLSFTVSVPDREESMALATGYAKAYRREIPPAPGLTTRGHGAHDAERKLGPVGWILLGGGAGLWIGMALAIVLGAKAARQR
jgi:hypothetical protein